MLKIAIIGAGIVGSSIARVLSKYEGLQAHLIEKEVDVGWGTSKSNTGIIHPGHEENPEKHPLRARLCSEGNRLWHLWAEELDIPVKWPGELMVAFDEEDFKEFQKYMEWSEKNGVPGIKIVYKDELNDLESNISPNAQGALWAPTAGQMSPWEAVIGLVENAVDNGVILHLETEVKGVRVREGEVKGLETNKGFIEANIIINASGLFADKISCMVGIDYFTIHPRKGEYYLFDESAFPKVTRILHPTPTPISKGVYVITTVENSLMIGPSAQDLQREMKEDRSTTHEGLSFVWNEAKKLVKELPPKSYIIKTFAGLRAEPSTGDFIIEAYEDPWGFVNVAGIRSPGLTSAPAIAYYVKELLERKYEVKFVQKRRWNPYRKGIQRFSNLPLEKKEKLIREKPSYGKIVCLCKEVTEAEILEAIKRIRKIGAKTVTLDGVKFRTLAMFGTCQGSYCRLKIARIISRELKIPLWEVTMRGKGSEYGMCDIKCLLRGERNEQ
ncbi:MAG: FAD/NAD(P)-binding oxidoreductase [Thermoprotei archaeon]|nr:MAG: FAD/NAD(P)-binding oxidoreductase [Thermoprotei archaeon]